MCYLITAEYKITTKTPWGSLDKQIEKAFNHKFDERGTLLASRPPVRVYTGERSDKKNAEAIVAKLKKITGVRVLMMDMADGGSYVSD